MKKSIGLILAIMVVLCMGTALADARQMIGGVVTDVQEDGTFICRSPFEEVAIKVDGNTVMETEDDLAPGMLVEVFFQPTEGTAVPEDVTALRVRDAIYLGRVEEVDKDGYRVLLNTPSFGDVWAQLPKTTDMDDLQYNNIAFRAYPIDGKSTIEEVEARDFTMCEELNGAIAQVGDGYVEFETYEDGLVRVNLSPETTLFYVPEEGRDAAIYYAESNGAEPLEVEAIAIVNSNG